MGSHNAKEVDNLMKELEQYFKTTSTMDKEAKVQFVALYLKDTIMLRWSRR